MGTIRKWVRDTLQPTKGENRLIGRLFSRAIRVFRAFCALRYAEVVPSGRRESVRFEPPGPGYITGVPKLADIP